MNNREINEKLIAVYNTLGLINVSGQQNVCNLAGCIGIVQEILITQTEKSNGDFNEDVEK